MNDLMVEKAQLMLNGIPEDQRREMIAKSRWTCDSHWMMSTVFNSGWETGNKANLQVAQSVGNVEMHRLMTALNLSKPRTRDEFTLLVTLAMESFITKDYMDYRYETSGEAIGLAIIDRCYADTKLRSIGAQKEYQCGCFGTRTGWYQAMGVEVKETLIKCLKEGDDRCEILVESVIFPK